MRSVEVDVTRQEIRDEFARWHIDRSDFEILWDTNPNFPTTRLPGAIVRFYRQNIWQEISCFRFRSRAENLRQCFLLLQRLRIAEKYGVQYAGLTSSKSVVSTNNAPTGEKEALLDAYDRLGVSPDDPIELIKDVFRKKSMYYHPDKGGTDEKFTKLRNAYELIMKSRGATP